MPRDTKTDSEDGRSDVTEKLEKVKETLEGEGKERAGGRERSLRERSPSLHRQVVCRRRKGAETNGSSGASTCSEDSDHSNDTFGEWGHLRNIVFSHMQWTKLAVCWFILMFF